MQKCYLYAFDFDHTLLDDNSDTAITSVLPHPIPKEIESIYKGHNWTEYMDSIMQHIGSHGVGIDEICEKIRELQFVPGMTHLLDRIRRAILANPASHLVIISDANTLFIQTALDNLKPKVTPNEIITNRVEVPEEGAKPSSEVYLKVIPYEHQTTCPICPPNLCKGAALVKYIEEHGPFDHVYYSGDGGNDLCPAMHLRESDTVFVRRGFSLERLIRQGEVTKKRIPIHIKAHIIYFDHGETIEKAMKF